LLKQNDDLDKGPDSKFYNAAVKYNSLKVLRFVWESSWKNFSDKGGTNTLKKNLTDSSTILKSKSFVRKSNFTIQNALQYHKNKKKNKNFKISELLLYFKKRNNKHAIAEILKWKFLEYDRDLLNILFQEELYNEVFNLIWNRKNLELNFTKDQFREVIKNGEQLDLILFFLKIPDCKVILDEADVQKSIVKNYMKYYLLIQEW
jgi:hypothetical protein